MRPIWVIDADCDAIPAEDLRKEVSRQGMRTQSVRFLPGNRFPADIAGGESLDRDASALFMGGPALMRHIQATRRWKPGGFCTFSNFACQEYYSHFGKFLLNGCYTILPAAEAVRQVDSIFEMFSLSGCVFVRPAPAQKLFGGALADQDKLQQLLTTRTLDPRMLVVISEPKQIDREWRLFVAGGKIVSASQYAAFGRPHLAADCPRNILGYGEQLLNQVAWRPDPLFAMDICESKGDAFLLELNGFSCSSPYHADIATLVEAAARFSALS